MDLVEVFQALSHPVRRQLLRQLPPHGELSRERLKEISDQSASNLTQHIKVLKRARLISARKCGNSRFYSLRRDTVLDLQRTLATLAQAPPRAQGDRANGPGGHDDAETRLDRPRDAPSERQARQHR